MKKATAQQAYNLKNKVDEFNSFEAASRWAANCNKLHLVVLGDNGKFWVACFTDAIKLVKQGLEIAE